MTGISEKLQLDSKNELNIEDYVTTEDEGEYAIDYDITSYGVDFDVDGLVRRIQKGDIYVPNFQRKFIWDITKSSKFIESILLDLPVPGIFLAQERKNKKMFIVDGQQRLLSLYYFFNGHFGNDNAKAFELKNVQRYYEGKTYEMLEYKDKNTLKDGLIHATVIKENSHTNPDAVFHIYERLNSGGEKLKPQEVRVAVYHGSFIDNIKKLNETTSFWRQIYGDIDPQMKDQELIIGFFALLEDYQNYNRPMKIFINNFVNKNRDNESLGEYSKLFIKCCNLFNNAVNDEKPFRRRIEKPRFNTAFFEAAMVGLAMRIKEKGEPNLNIVTNAYESLIENKDFDTAISHPTDDEKAVKQRISMAVEIFSKA